MKKSKTTLLPSVILSKARMKLIIFGENHIVKSLWATSPNSDRRVLWIGCFFFCSSNLKITGLSSKEASDFGWNFVAICKISSSSWSSIRSKKESVCSPRCDNAISCQVLNNAAHGFPWLERGIALFGFASVLVFARFKGPKCLVPKKKPQKEWLRISKYYGCEHK